MGRRRGGVVAKGLERASEKNSNTILLISGRDY